MHCNKVVTLDDDRLPRLLLSGPSAGVNLFHYVRNAATHCNTLQHTATRCNTAIHCNKVVTLDDDRLPRILLLDPSAGINLFHYVKNAATHCNLQHIATHCNTLQHTVIHCDTLRYTVTQSNTLQHAATRCNTLQHTGKHCNTLQHTATHW